MNGKPYQLKKLNDKSINNPCELCDLRTECGYPDGLDHFMQLCTNDNRDDAWYFEEDWMIYGKELCDFISPEFANDFLNQ